MPVMPTPAPNSITFWFWNKCLLELINLHMSRVIGHLFRKEKRLNGEISLAWRINTLWTQSYPFARRMYQLQCQHLSAQSSTAVLPPQPPWLQTYISHLIKKPKLQTITTAPLFMWWVSSSDSLVVMVLGIQFFYYIVCHTLHHSILFFVFVLSLSSAILVVVWECVGRRGKYFFFVRFPFLTRCHKWVDMCDTW